MTNTADLRAAAEAATRGPWSVRWDGYLSGPDGEKLEWDHEGLGQSWGNEADAAYIALASPDRILAICEELERKTAALEQLMAAHEAIAFYNSGTEMEPVESLDTEDFNLLDEAVEQARAALEGKPSE